ncbi:MAG: RNA polymerase sigma factor [Kiritimatiellae bacterium]|nr:RNA polymerase sigma factor [Kiritimatiellia bacterium]
MTVEAAYREAGPKIVGYLVATGTDEATARDLLHDAFERIVARGERPGDDLCALAFSAARNLRANRARDDSRLSVVERPEDLDTRTTDGRPATEATDSAYVRRRLAAAFAALPYALREAYTLYQVGERSVREIADIAGVTENLVKVRLYRAKMALRKELSDLCSRQTRFR